jgi:hypothetical protein
LYLDEPAADAEEGFLDLTIGYAFVNQHALYLLVETAEGAEAPDGFGAQTWRV